MDRQNEYQDERWKERARQIRELDGHKCALCGAKGLLHVHHLSYPPTPYHLWDSTDNELVTLCPDCHRKVHESPTRPYLDEDRIIRNYINPDTYGKMIEGFEEQKRKYNEKFNEAISCGRDCCALCNHHQTYLYHSICWDKHAIVEPTDYCKEFYMSD